MEDIAWHTAMYFTVTLFSTVGLGDIVPVSAAGRFAVVGMIVVGAITIPIQTSRLVSDAAPSGTFLIILLHVTGPPVRHFPILAP
eukprot:3901430-Pyramimonas_sp.AAC.2